MIDCKVHTWHSGFVEIAPLSTTRSSKRHGGGAVGAGVGGVGGDVVSGPGLKDVGEPVGAVVGKLGVAVGAVVGRVVNSGGRSWQVAARSNEAQLTIGPVRASCVVFWWDLSIMMTLLRVLLLPSWHRRMDLGATGYGGPGSIEVQPIGKQHGFEKSCLQHSVWSLTLTLP